MKTTNRRNLFILVFALLVVMLGFGMVIPVFPSIIDKRAGGSRRYCRIRLFPVYRCAGECIAERGASNEIPDTVVTCAGYFAHPSDFLGFSIRESSFYSQRESSERSFGKHTDHKQQKTIRSHILTIDKYHSPWFVYFLTIKDTDQFK